MPPVVVSGGGFGRQINTRKDSRERTWPGRSPFVLRSFDDIDPSLRELRSGEGNGPANSG
jgi:hypothetical protein